MFTAASTAVNMMQTICVTS